jgi:hypothetical protein
MSSQAGAVQAQLIPVVETEESPASTSDRHNSAHIHKQPPGQLVYHGGVFRYSGYRLDTAYKNQSVFRPRSFLCTHEELGVDPQCDPDRICAMLDAVGASRQRQEEILLYGKRVWHSPLRPEPAWEQALDWAFGHDVQLVRVLAHEVESFFLQVAPATADTWIQEVRWTFCQRRFEYTRLIRALRRLHLPAETLKAFCNQAGIDIQDEA